VLTPTPIDRVPELRADEFRARYEEPERPVVIAGGASQFAATRRWSLEYLTAAIGAIEAPFKVSETSSHPNFRATEPSRMFAREKTSFAEFFRSIAHGAPAERARRLFTGDERFLLQRRGGKSVRDPELGVLLDDVPVPGIVPEERLYTAWGWFSGPGVRTWLHYDNNGCHNVNAQLTGSKECLLFAPRELGKLAPFPLGGDNPAHNCSQVDIDDVDASRFPDFDDVPCERAELQAGDLLFIPAFWFHTFRHRGEFNSNVNFWYKPERLRPNPVATRQALLDLVAAAGIPATSDPRARELLAALDQAAVKGL